MIKDIVSTHSTLSVTTERSTITKALGQWSSRLDLEIEDTLYREVDHDHHHEVSRKFYFLPWVLVWSTRHLDTYYLCKNFWHYGLYETKSGELYWISAEMQLSVSLQHNNFESKQWDLQMRPKECMSCFYWGLLSIWGLLFKVDNWTGDFSFFKIASHFRKYTSGLGTVTHKMPVMLLVSGLVIKVDYWTGD